jgi:hypothetical protein
MRDPHTGFLCFEITVFTAQLTNHLELENVSSAITSSAGIGLFLEGWVVCLDPSPCICPSDFFVCLSKSNRLILHV